MQLKMATGSSVKVAEQVFGQEFNEALVHQVVTAYLAGARAGTKAQKNRSEVSGGGAKPWRQKGTGRARAGSIRSPIWRSGGVTFAAKPRDYSQKVNRKMYRLATCSILSELLRQERLVVVDKLELKEAKTKALSAKLKELNCENAFIVTENIDNNLQLAARNLSNANYADLKAVNPVSLISAEKVLITQAALKKLEERLA